MEGTRKGVKEGKTKEEKKEEKKEKGGMNRVPHIILIRHYPLTLSNRSLFPSYQPSLACCVVEPRAQSMESTP
jgi:hypothetical protein